MCAEKSGDEKLAELHQLLEGSAEITREDLVRLGVVKVVSEEEFLKMGSKDLGIAVVRHSDGSGYVVTFHENEALPPFAQENVASPAEAKRRWPGYAWRRPRKRDDAPADVVLIGEPLWISHQRNTRM